MLGISQVVGCLWTQRKSPWSLSANLKISSARARNLGATCHQFDAYRVAFVLELNLRNLSAHVTSISCIVLVTKQYQAFQHTMITRSFEFKSIGITSS